jgi:hypothetical protein
MDPAPPIPPPPPDRGPGAAAPGGLPALLGLALGALVVALSWPMAADPGRMVVGSTWNDACGIIWGLDHVARQATEGALSLHTDRMLAPAGATVLVADLPESLALAPITRRFGPVVSFNLLQVLHVGLAGWAAAWAARRLGEGAAGQALAAAAFALSPALLSSVANQNPDVTAWWPVPLVLALARDARLPGEALRVGLLAGFAALLNPYGGVMAALCLLLLPLSRPGLAARLSAAGLGLGLLGGGAAGLMAWATAAPDSATGKIGRTSAHGVATLLDLVRPWPRIMTTSTDAAGDATSVVVHGAWLGGVLLLAGLWGLRRDRRSLLVGALGLLFALGPVVHVSPERGLFMSPFQLVEAHSGLDRLHLNHRYTALAALLLGLGAARGATRLGRGGWLLCAAVVAELLVGGRAGALLRPVALEDDGAVNLLADSPPGAVFDLPASLDEAWLCAAAAHGRPVAQGLNRPAPDNVVAALEDADPVERAGILARAGYRLLVLHPHARRRDGLDLVVDTAGCSTRSGARGARVVDLSTCPSGPSSGGGSSP